MCGYRPEEDLCSTSGSTAIVNYQYSQDELGKIVENIIGGDDSSHFYDEANNPDPMFPDDESDSDSDGEYELHAVLALKSLHLRVRF